MEKQYLPQFVFNKKVDAKLQDALIMDFVEKRDILVERLNPHYEEWNAEFDTLGKPVMENDPLEDFGGTEYCKFITAKQQEYADKVNEERKSLVELKISKDGDIYGVYKDVKIKLRLVGVK